MKHDYDDAIIPVRILINVLNLEWENGIFLIFLFSVGFNADFFFTTVHLWVYRAI